MVVSTPVYCEHTFDVRLYTLSEERVPLMKKKKRRGEDFAKSRPCRRKGAIVLIASI